MNQKILVITAAALMLAVGCTNPNSSADPAQKDQEAEANPTSQTTDNSADPGADSAADNQQTDSNATTDNDQVTVVPLRHGSLLLESGDTVIAVDPVTKALDAVDDDLPQADVVLVTHIHPDHLDPAAIATLPKDGAPVYAPQSVVDKAGDALPNPTVLANGESADLDAPDITIAAVPMYNLQRKQGNGQFYHPKGRGNGYVLGVADQRIYISGDTECTPEMKQLDDIDIAFISMNLPYTMPPEEAAPCIAAFKPDVVYPYHYHGQDPSVLGDMIPDDVELKLVDWYPDETD